MNGLHKRFLLVALTLLIAFVSAGAVALVRPNDVPKVATAANDEYVASRIIVGGGDTFGNTGIYICRPQNTNPTNTYWGSVSKDGIGDMQYFYPTVRALIKVNDTWQEVTNDDFQTVLSADKGSVYWTLKESAPAATYGVSCEYEGVRDIFQVVYTDTWTYVSVTNADNQTYLTNFFGGRSRRLNFYIDYNDGATVLSVLDEGQELPNKVRYGRISPSAIITANSLQVSMSTVDGDVYPENRIYTEISGNILTVSLDDTLANQTYILKLSSALDDKVYGQFIIDNAGNAGGVNLSQAWIWVMIFGGVLVLVGVVAFFVPLLIIKINQGRVYRENVRVAKMKNPNAYVGDDDNVLQKLKKGVKNLRKGGAKEEPEVVVEKPQVEDKSDRVRVTDIIHQNREARKAAEENAISGGKIEAMKKQEEINQNAQKRSFAFLRDDDDEIASLYEEKEEIPTIETGSYVEDGVTFSKLDSLRDEDDHQ